jgi:hypothetical protein
VFQFISTSLESTNSYFLQLMRGLAGRGFALKCGSLSEEKVPAWLCEVPDLDYYYLNAPARYQYARAIVQLARILRRERIDVLHTHLYYASFVGILAARLAGTPVVTMQRHHMNEVFLTGTSLHRALDRWMTRAADHVIASSQSVRRHMVENEGAALAKVEVIQLGFAYDDVCGAPEDRQRIRSQ